MTNNKIRPFCCEMSDATEEQIRELHSKCIEAGANDLESDDSWGDGRTDYPFMGVDDENDTLATTHKDLGESFNNNIITLDQVDDHLGLTLEADKPSINDSPIKWTIAMKKAGKPLTIGMLALCEDGDVVKVDYEGEYNFMVTYLETKVEDLWGKNTLLPFPDEETPEQKEQRKEFTNAFSNRLHLSTDLHEELNPDDFYEAVKHLFKY